MAAVRTLKLVTLDVTNTIIRVAGSPGRQYAFIARNNGLEMDEEVLNGLFFQKYKKYSRSYPNFGSATGMPAATWWSGLVKDCFKAADASLPDRILGKLADELYFHYTTPQAWEFLPGAVEAIQDLHRYPIKLGIISNWDHRLYKLLFALGLRQYFSFVLPSYVVDMEKPDRGIFLLALKDGQCAPNEAVHFGDDIEKDFIGAQNIGMSSYLLATDGVKNNFLDPNLVVNSLSSFVNAIRPRLGKPLGQEL